MADATGRFQNPATLKSESFRRLIHGADDNGSRVMSVECGRAGLLIFFVRKLSLQRFLFFRPGGIGVVEDLGHGAPAGVFDQRGLLVRGGRSRLGFQHAKNLDGPEILLELLFGTACSQTVVVGDAMVVEIAGRFSERLAG